MSHFCYDHIVVPHARSTPKFNLPWRELLPRPCLTWISDISLTISSSTMSLFPFCPPRKFIRVLLNPTDPLYGASVSTSAVEDYLSSCTRQDWIFNDVWKTSSHAQHQLVRQHLVPTRREDVSQWQRDDQWERKSTIYCFQSVKQLSPYWRSWRYPMFQRNPYQGPYVFDVLPILHASGWISRLTIRHWSFAFVRSLLNTSTLLRDSTPKPQMSCFYSVCTSTDTRERFTMYPAQCLPTTTTIVDFKPSSFLVEQASMLFSDQLLFFALHVAFATLLQHFASHAMVTPTSDGHVDDVVLLILFSIVLDSALKWPPHSLRVSSDFRRTYIYLELSTWKSHCVCRHVNHIPQEMDLLTNVSPFFSIMI